MESCSQGTRFYISRIVTADSRKKVSLNAEFFQFPQLLSRFYEVLILSIILSFFNVT